VLVIVTGFIGQGKSTVGQIAAEMLEAPFIKGDDYAKELRESDCPIGQQLKKLAPDSSIFDSVEDLRAQQAIRLVCVHLGNELSRFVDKFETTNLVVEVPCNAPLENYIPSDCKMLFLKVCSNRSLSPAQQKRWDYQRAHAISRDPKKTQEIFNFVPTSLERLRNQVYYALR